MQLHRRRRKPSHAIARLAPRPEHRRQRRALLGDERGQAFIEMGIVEPADIVQIGINPFGNRQYLSDYCDEQGIWHTPWDTSDSDYQELPLPAELRHAIDGRLRELPPHARATLAAAAVLGQNFSPETLARMTADDRRPTTDNRIAPVVSRRSSAVADQLLHGQFLVEERGGYRFGHNTLREVVYGELDEPTRQALHLRAAEVLEQEHYARVEALAQHLYLAGAWDKATPYLVQAGDHARAVCAYRAALRCYDQALAATEKLQAQMIGAGDSQDLATRWTINLKRGEICALLSDYVEAARAYRQALILAGKETAASRLGARRSAQIQALNGLAFVYGLTNDYDHARAFSRRAITLAAESPRLQDRAAAFYQAGQTGYHMNNYEEALTYLQQALDLYEAVDARDGQARCLERLAWIWRRQAGVTDQVIENLRRALAIYLELGDEYHEQHCRVSLANAHLLRGAFDEVLQSCDTVLPFFRASDARYSIAECQYLRGLALYAIGRLPEALVALDETVDVCQGLGILAGTGAGLGWLGALISTGRHLRRAMLTEVSHCSYYWNTCSSKDSGHHYESCQGRAGSNPRNAGVPGRPSPLVAPIGDSGSSRVAEGRGSPNAGATRGAWMGRAG